MKIVVIIFLLILSAVLGVMLHDTNQHLIFDHFPVDKIEGRSTQSYFPLFLYIFFSQQDPPACLEIIQELNQLPAYFKVQGVVPDDQLKNEKQFRQTTGATFPLAPLSRYWQYQPFYSPTILCASEKGRILFIQPVISSAIENFQPALLIFYQHVSASLLKEKK